MDRLSCLMVVVICVNYPQQQSDNSCRGLFHSCTDSAAYRYARWIKIFQTENIYPVVVRSNPFSMKWVDATHLAENSVPQYWYETGKSLGGLFPTIFAWPTHAL